MRRLVLSLASFLLLFIFAQNFAHAAPQRVKLAPKQKMPYKCHDLKASKVIQHSSMDIEYHFKGICTVKNAEDHYQDVWIKAQGRWKKVEHTAEERIMVMGAGGGIIEISMKCEADPWRGAARCALLNFGNSTEFSSLVSTFRVNKDKQILSYPPISRGAIGIEEQMQSANSGHSAKTASDQEVVNNGPDNTESLANDVAEEDEDSDQGGLQLRISAGNDSGSPNVVIKEENGRPRLHLERPQATQVQPGATSEVVGVVPRIVAGAEQETVMDSETSNVFFNPTFKGTRLHFCHQRDKHCGRVAAASWCKLRGFHGVESFQSASNIGRTVHIGDGSICRSLSCDGFESITCAK